MISFSEINKFALDMMDLLFRVMSISAWSVAGSSSTSAKQKSAFLYILDTVSPYATAFLLALITLTLYESLKRTFLDRAVVSSL